jgi:nucleotide-binding universal stress UspA family protein
MYKRILVPVDGSNSSNIALDEAIRLAKGRQAGLRVVHVVDTINLNVDSMADIAESLRESSWKLLREAEARARRARVKAETELLEIQKVSERISDLVVKDAATWRADVIVMGTHGRRGLNRLLLGSVADGVVRVSSVPVLLIRGK